MRTRFQQGLEELKEKLLRMAGLSEQAVDRATAAYRQHDRKYCDEVFEIEDAINRAEREIDELALDLLAMQQPMAVDLRFILAVIKINGNLERVGDQAVNIVQRVLDVLNAPAAEFPVDIPLMCAIVSRMIRDSIEAFLSGDAELAQRVLERDDDVDRMKREIEIVMLGEMHRSPDLIQPAFDTLLIARNLERIADHATNIAEDVIFWVRGADVRHHLGSARG